MEWRVVSGLSGEWNEAQIGAEWGEWRIENEAWSVERNGAESGEVESGEWEWRERGSIK